MLGAKIYLDRGVIDAILDNKKYPKESPSAVLRRLLDLPPSHEKRGRKPKGRRRRPRPKDEDGES
jgi:hypothetical protein